MSQVPLWGYHQPVPEFHLLSTTDLDDAVPRGRCGVMVLASATLIPVTPLSWAIATRYFRKIAKCPLGKDPLGSSLAVQTRTLPVPQAKGGRAGHSCSWGVVTYLSWLFNTSVIRQAKREGLHAVL